MEFTKKSPDPKTEYLRHNGALDLAKDIPPRARPDVLNELLPGIFGEIAAALPHQMEDIYSAVKLLSAQPNFVKACIKLFTSLPLEAFYKKHLILQVLGESRRSDAVLFLQDVVRKGLPLSKPVPVYCLASDSPKSPSAVPVENPAEMLAAKAVQGLAFLRTDKALNDVLRIAMKHPSRIVRLAAIDAYLWNRGDTKEAREYLLSKLPKDLHAAVTRTRFVGPYSIGPASSPASKSSRRRSKN